MRILLSTENFDAFGGLETYTLTVAQDLLRLGHGAAIYARRSGGMAELARSRGVAVIGEQELPRECDLILAQDAATCHELAARYPQTVRTFVTHSRDHVLHDAPQLPGVCDGVVTMNDRVARWVRARAWHAPLTRLRQPIDLARYRDLPPPRPRPRRVLITSNYVDGPRGRLLEEACRRAGYEVEWIGTTTRPTSKPEQAIAAADIVVGLGRSALEGMAAGRAVYIYGATGTDGWVTARSYGQFEADGFAGLTDPRPGSFERLVGELRDWQPEMGEVARDLAGLHSVRTHVVELIELAGSLSEERSGGGPVGAGVSEKAGAGNAATQAPLPVEEMARMLRLEWQMYEQRMRAILEADYLRRERDLQRERADDAAERVLLLDEQLAGAHARVATLDEHLVDSRVRIGELESTASELSQRLTYRLTRRLTKLLEGLRARAAGR
ncbi:MAG: hypothetical protein ACRDK4_15695 [Solirubrobacteraceae bacterium]